VTTTVGAVVEIEHGRIRPFADQPREYFDQGALRDLARSIKAAGQRTPIVVRPLAGDAGHDFELVDGQRRWLAVGMLKRPTIRAIVEEFANEDDQYLASVVANFAREGHSPVECAKAIDRLLKRSDIQALAPMQRVTRIAEIFGRSDAWVYFHHSLLRLDETVLAMMHPSVEDGRRIVAQVGFMLASLPKEMQAGLAHEISENALTIRAAKRLIDKYALKTGLRVAASGNKGKSSRLQPRKVREAFLNQVNRLADDANYLLDLKLADFQRMFAGRPQSEQESALYRVEETIDRLQELRGAIKRVMARRAA
jgi:ParB/RepB/Spo0J family partition protein